MNALPSRITVESRLLEARRIAQAVRDINGLEIPDHEVLFTVSRSGGPGGQNVNKVSTRVTLRFDVEASEVLTAEQRRLIFGENAVRLYNL